MERPYHKFLSLFVITVITAPIAGRCPDCALNRPGRRDRGLYPVCGWLLARVPAGAPVSENPAAACGWPLPAASS